MTPTRARRAGVIAAGRGERLRAASAAPKPLVRVGGRTLIDRVLASIAETGPSEVAIIINEESLAVRDHVARTRWPFELRWIVETTPSSMHSFLRVVETLARDGDPGPFLISTVDTVAPAGAYARFVDEAERHPDTAVTLALTTAIDDEKPLLARRDGRRVVAIGAGAAGAAEATAGYYAVTSAVLAEADAARRDGLDALRKFLGRLLDRGYRVDGITMPDSIDVDRPLDVEVAERRLRQVAP